MFRYCTGLVSFCGLYVLQKCRVSISFVRIDVFGTNQVFFLCVKAVAIKIYHGQLFCLQYRLRKFCLRLRQAVCITQKQRQYFCCNTTGSGGKQFCVVWRVSVALRIVWKVEVLPMVCRRFILETEPAFGVCRVGCDVNFGTRIFICRNRQSWQQQSYSSQ